MENNTFKDIPGYEDLYQINTEGTIKSLQTEMKNECILKPFLVDGYLSVKLSKGDRIDRKQMLVHRLVAITFIANPENKPQVNHLNGIRTDARVNNLEWVTSRENQTHRIVTNKRTTSKYTGVSWNKMRQKWSAQIGYNGRLIVLGFFDNEEIASLTYKTKCEEMRIKNKYAVFAELNEF